MGQVLEVERKPLVFEQFCIFISLEGLDPKTATVFPNFLRKLFERTPERLWHPESCCGIVEIARNARKISADYFPGQTSINVLMGAGHLWSVVKQANQTEIILEAVIPYFGTLSACSFEGYPLLRARQVYSEGEVLTLEQEEALLRYQEILLDNI